MGGRWRYLVVMDPTFFLRSFMRCAFRPLSSGTGEHCCNAWFSSCYCCIEVDDWRNTNRQIGRLNMSAMPAVHGSGTSRSRCPSSECWPMRELRQFKHTLSAKLGQLMLVGFNVVGVSSDDRFARLPVCPPFRCTAFGHWHLRLGCAKCPMTYTSRATGLAAVPCGHCGPFGCLDSHGWRRWSGRISVINIEGVSVNVGTSSAVCRDILGAG